MQRAETERRRKQVCKSLLILAAILAGICVLRFCIRVTTVRGISMEATLSNGDCLVIDRLSYCLKDPERFDIVVFSYQYRPNTYYIKRVIALPGERVRIGANGVIYVNGSALIEHYSEEKISKSGLAQNEIVLGADEYFILGDNRNDSLDSREPNIGNIKRSDIVGRAWLRLLPCRRFGVLK